MQKARLGLGYDSEATVLDRCVTYSDSGLTWEADLRHAELAVAEFGLQTARPQTSPGGAKQSAPLDHEKLEPDGQKACHSVSARVAYLASDRPDIAFPCKECSRAVGKATRADLTRLKRIGRYLLCTPRAVWEFPLQQEESIVLIDGLSDADAADLEDACVSNDTLDNLVVDTEGGVTEQRRVRILQHGTLCERGHRPIQHKSWNTRLTYESGQVLQQDWLSAMGAAPSNT